MNTTTLAAFAAILVALTSTTAQQPSQPKPPVGVPADAKLFNGKWYRVYLEKGSWKNARMKCGRLGGQLAVVPDAPTQAFIKSFAKGLRLWLGANDEKVEGQWIWEDGTEMKYKAWGAGQPGNHLGREHWLAIGATGNWVDLHETADMVGYICEWKAR